MAAISTALLALRKNGRILQLPPYFSILLILVGLGWLLLLPLSQYNRQTYTSENALLPGQVHTYFGGSEHNIFRAYRHEVAAVEHIPHDDRIRALEGIFRDAGLKTARQKWKYEAGGGIISAGENVYAVLQGPRADATEAMVLIAAWRNMDGKINYSGVALVLTLARYFSRWSLWSKDIIFLITEDSTAGSQAWVDAYHNAHDATQVESLTLKSGALQGAIAVDYPAGPWGQRFDKLHIVYDGVNGQLPNLDLFNTAVSIASGQMGIGCTLQRMWEHSDSYSDRLNTMLRGMLNQALGHATGPHSAFIPYHVDAITLQTVGDGWHDEMSLGRAVEGLIRSLNNLLEHLHQSFFFYLLMQANRFVSIGTYLPSAMLVAGSFTIMSIALWVKSGRIPNNKSKSKASTTDDAPKTCIESPTPNEKETQSDMTLIKSGSSVALVPTSTITVTERHLFLPLTLLAAIHFLALIPFYTFTHLPPTRQEPAFLLFTMASIPLPYLTATLGVPSLIKRTLTEQERTLIHCFTLMLAGLFLSALATLNFSLSLLIGTLSTPLCFLRPTRKKLAAHLQIAVLTLLSPALVITLATNGITRLVPHGQWGGMPLREVLGMAMTGWWIHGLWTGLVVWLVWWPAWFAGSFVVASGLFGS